MEEFRYVPDKTRTNANKKSLLLAYLLALPPVGLFGAHRLYLGHEQHFVWYSLTFGNCFFGWIIDLLFLPKIVEIKNESLHVANSKDMEKRYFINTLVLWFPIAGILGAHRYYQGDVVHGVFYTLTAGNILLSWFADGFRFLFSLLSRSLYISPPFPLALITTHASLFYTYLLPFVWLLSHAHTLTLIYVTHIPPSLSLSLRIASLVRQERWDTFDAVLLWLPPSGLLGGHRYFSGHLLHAISYSFTLGNAVMGWIIDGFRLPTLMKNSPGSKKRLENQGQV
jgi:TM2 domain-containing membrane protein YozV